MHRGEVFNHLTSEQQISPPEEEFAALSDESSLIVLVWPFDIPESTEKQCIFPDTWEYYYPTAIDCPEVFVKTMSKIYFTQLLH